MQSVNLSTEALTFLGSVPARSHTQLQCEPVGSEVQSVKLSIAGFRLSHPEAEIA